MVEQISTCSLGGPYTGAGGCPKKALTPGAGEKCEEERAAETTCDELTTTPIHCCPVLRRGKR